MFPAACIINSQAWAQLMTSKAITVGLNWANVLSALGCQLQNVDQLMNYEPRLVTPMTAYCAKFNVCGYGIFLIAMGTGTPFPNIPLPLYCTLYIKVDNCRKLRLIWHRMYVTHIWVTEWIISGGPNKKIMLDYCSETQWLLIYDVWDNNIRP